jgi:hypothetical protein
LQTLPQRRTGNVDQAVLAVFDVLRPVSRFQSAAPFIDFFGLPDDPIIATLDLNICVVAGRHRRWLDNEIVIAVLHEQHGTATQRVARPRFARRLGEAGERQAAHEAICLAIGVAERAPGIGSFGNQTEIAPIGCQPLDTRGKRTGHSERLEVTPVRNLGVEHCVSPIRALPVWWIGVRSTATPELRSSRMRLGATGIDDRYPSNRKVNRGRA